MSSFDEITNLYWPLKMEWKKNSPNFELCSSMLMEIKVAIINHKFLPTNKEETSLREYYFTREILEIGVQCSIGLQDIPAFERYMNQLKPYYLDYKDKIIPDSNNEYHMFGLNLLFLLSQNRIGEFHTELELLPLDVIETNPHIIHSVAIEQYLMEGNYNKIFETKNNVPTGTYHFFMDILLGTVRNEIAKCMLVAYKKMSINSATEMLHFGNTNEMKEFAKKNNWLLDENDYYVFQHEEKIKKPLPVEQIAAYNFQYVKDLDIIV